MRSSFGCLRLIVSAVVLGLASAESPAVPDDDPVLPEIDSRTFVPVPNGPCSKSCVGHQPHPVCAFDPQENILRTFQNICDLQVGECYAARIFTVISYDESCEYACPKRCPTDYNEVCGSDNVTYKNPCKMKQTACKLRTRLVFQNWGRCKRDKLVFPHVYVR